MPIVKKFFRAIAAFSMAAFYALISKGPKSAKNIMVSTIQAYRKKKFPRMTYWDVVRSFYVNDNISIFGGEWMDGTIDPLERFIIALLIKFFKPKIICEIGTFKGTTTRLMLDNMEPTARVYTVDLPLDTDPAKHQKLTDIRLIKNREVGIDFRHHLLSNNVNQIYGNTLEALTWKKIPKDIDFAFIDGSHSYIAVRNDSERIWPKLSKNAVVIWHDYTDTESSERGVGKYLRELIKTHHDIFVCEETSLAIRIPENKLLTETKKIATFFSDISFFKKKHPRGIIPWLKNK